MAKAGRLIKEVMVRELSDALGPEGNFFVTSVGRLKANEADALRKQLRGLNGRLCVSKRSLSARGCSVRQLEDVQPWLTGSVAFVLAAGDVTRTAKIIVDFAKTNQEKLTVRGGRVDGQLLDSRDVEQLAGLPPRLELMASVVGAVEGPLASVVMAVEGLLGELAWVMDELSRRRTAPAAEAAPQASRPASETEVPTETPSLEKGKGNEKEVT